MVAFLFNYVLFAAHMFSGLGGADSPKRRFEDVINSIKWPSHITRLPKNVRNLSLHYSRLHVICIAWRQSIIEKSG